MSRLNATRLVVRFQDGTLVDTDLADNLPPVCDLSAASGSEAVDVVAALPLLSASGGNLDNGQDSERPRRWKSERVVVQELAGHESGELAILRHALTLRLSIQENTAYLTCPAAGLNKLRMEDKRGEEHIKLSTEYGGKTQLNLGHNVNASRELRGEGAELRTDRHVSIRGGAGVFITADKQPFAGDKMLSMREAISQLENALSIARSLSDAAETAEALPADIQSQKLLTDALTDLTKPGILLNAPQGVSISSPEGVRISSGSASVGIVAQNNVDISALKRFTVAAGEAVSMLARKAGMKLFAARGKVEIQAQDDVLEAIAKKDITVTSAEGKVEITAAMELVINCDGAYIKLAGGNIELGAPGNILLKCANVQKMGATSLNTPAPEFPKGYGGVYSLTDEEGKIIPQTEYKVTTADGQVFHGISDDNGKTLPIYTTMPGKLNIEILGTGKSATGSK
ncbi:TPA: DUF2345 domain-containing protein [Klebsiella aerogenes]|nr:DUF2345 domain-containing protein [Klebsiella aerogenes]